MKPPAQDITRIVNSTQQEIHTVIEYLENSFTDVEKGTENLTDTGQAMQHIKQSVTHVANSIKEVTNGLKQLTNQSINQQSSHSMDQVLQNAGELERLVKELNEKMDQLNSLCFPIKAWVLSVPSYWYAYSHLSSTGLSIAYRKLSIMKVYYVLCKSKPHSIMTVRMTALIIHVKKLCRFL